MARRIRDLPDDAEFHDLEDELIPEEDPYPDAGGPFTRCFEYLHGARVTLDADLPTPTRLLTITAARSVLRVADESGTEIPDQHAERFQAIADGDLPEEQDALVEALAELSGFVERQVQASKE